ncbi:MAG: hypothetical protein ACFFAN_19460 [Promethearchaeota archaeon]
MINNNDRDDKEFEAIRLIDQAETLVDKDEGIEAINLYEKAAQIYLELGSYIKLDELYIRISQIIAQFKNNIQSMYRLKSIIRKTEELKLYEISAKMLIQLANVAYNMNDWETAGECWQKASDYLYKTDPEEYYTLSSALLLKAGQVFERSPLTKAEGKRLILKAVMKINRFDELYEQEEKRGLYLIANKEFEASANKFYEIANFFRKAIDNLEKIIDDKNSKDTLLNAEARFIHFVAEYQTLAALCLRASKNSSHNEKIKELGEDSINLFKKSILLLKDYLLPKKTYFDHEVILRITFDIMLLSFIQEMIGTCKIDPRKFLLENLEENKPLIAKLKETPYYKITKRLEKVGFRESLKDLLNVNLGHFEKIKNTIISYFL